MVVGVDAVEIVAGHQRAVGPDDHIVKVVADRQQLTKCRLVQTLPRADALSKAFWFVLLQVHHLLLRIPLYAAIDPRLRVPLQEIEEVAPGLPVLECD